MKARLISAQRLHTSLIFLVLVWTCASITYAFSIPVHLRVTDDELEAMKVVVNEREVTFSERALEQIGEANEAVDSIIFGSAALFRPERHFTDEEFRDATQRLIDLREDIIREVTTEPRDGHTARERLGQALHTIQDFYSHSTWVELGNGNINNAFGRNTVGNPGRAIMPCPMDPNIVGPGAGGAPSSAYYLGILGCNEDDLPAGKCFHGNYTQDCIGINKDLDAVGAAAEGVPQNPLHGAAVALARTATRDYVQQIFDELAGDDQALAALLDLRGSLGFVIDDTGSMGPEIAGVRNTVGRIVNFVSNNPNLSPDDYLLVRFGDPQVGSAFVTEDPSALLNAVSAISPRGGGDCPELAQAGLLEGIDAAFVNSRLYFFSDASSKDASRANQVISRAQDKGIEIIYALTGSCSPIDPAYVRTAEETGGQVFLLSAGEIPLLFDLIRPQLLGDLNLVSRRKGDLGTNGSVVLPAPVDSTMTGLVVAVSIDLKNDVRLIRPDGTAVADGDPGVTIADLASGCILNVENPVMGEWTVEIDGSGEFTASIQGNSPIDLARVDFVEPNPEGDVHGGFFPIPGQPVIGAEALAEATLFGQFASTTFELVDEFGIPFEIVDLEQGFPKANPDHFLGAFDLPSLPFRISVSGLDANGARYQRQYPVVFRAQTVSVEVQGLRVLEVAPGETAELTFEVTNLGTTGTFFNSASDSLGFVASVQPSSLRLDMGETGVITVRLDVPANAPDGEASTVVLTSTRSGNVETFNSATTVVTVAGNRPPVCSVADGLDVVLWPPNHKLVNIDVLAVTEITDPDGDPVTVEVVGISQDEPVSGVGSGSTAPDGRGVGTGVAGIRAERTGGGNGRVYEVGFVASDDQGASCDGTLRVSVPHDQSTPAVDDGQLFDSTAD